LDLSPSDFVVVEGESDVLRTSRIRRGEKFDE